LKETCKGCHADVSSGHSCRWLVDADAHPVDTLNFDSKREVQALAARGASNGPKEVKRLVVIIDLHMVCVGSGRSERVMCSFDSNSDGCDDQNCNDERKVHFILLLWFGGKRKEENKKKKKKKRNDTLFFFLWLLLTVNDFVFKNKMCFSN
jgi:hypothetical protein